MLGPCKDSSPLLFPSPCSDTPSIPPVSLPPTHNQAWLVADWELTFCETIKNAHYWGRKEGRNQRDRRLFTAGVPWSVLHSFPSSSTFYLHPPSLSFFLPFCLSFFLFFVLRPQLSFSLLHHCQKNNNVSTMWRYLVKIHFTFSNDECNICRFHSGLHWRLLLTIPRWLRCGFKSFSEGEPTLARPSCLTL